MITSEKYINKRPFKLRAKTSMGIYCGKVGDFFVFSQNKKFDVVHESCSEVIDQLLSEIKEAKPDP